MDAGVKQRRPTEKQLLSVGGVWLPASHRKSLTAGLGAGNTAALAVPGPAAAAMAAAQARAADALARLHIRTKGERTMCTSVVAGSYVVADGRRRSQRSGSTIHRP